MPFNAINVIKNHLILVHISYAKANNKKSEQCYSEIHCCGVNLPLLHCGPNLHPACGSHGRRGWKERCSAGSVLPLRSSIAAQGPPLSATYLQIYAMSSCAFRTMLHFNPVKQSEVHWPSQCLCRTLHHVSVNSPLFHTP